MELDALSVSQRTNMARYSVDNALSASIERIGQDIPGTHPLFAAYVAATRQAEALSATLRAMHDIARATYEEEEASKSCS